MGSYFKPWRRKLGVVTLVFSCLSMAGWVRSQVVWDDFDIPFWQCLHRFESRHGHITLHRRWMENADVDITKYYDTIRWRTRKIDGRTDSVAGIISASHGWLFEHFGKALCHDITVAYWIIALPLTFISFWLLLSKSRKSNQKNNAELITAEGP